MRIGSFQAIFMAGLMTLFVADGPALELAQSAAEETTTEAARDEPDGTDELEEEASGDPLADEEYYKLLRMFVDTLDQVERNYVKDLSRRDLLEAAIDGMLGKLDQHSDYISPDELDSFKSGVESEFGGIGIQVSRQPEGLVIISPLVGSPAYRAGLMAGDLITKIEGESASNLSLDEAIQRMKGPVGTNVEITVRHPRGEGVESVTIQREIVRVETVLGHDRKGDDTWTFLLDPEKKIGYIRVTAFARHTVADLRKALRQLRDEEMQGLILDLRYNPGGLLSSAIQTADLFVESGRIVSTDGRNVEPMVWDAHGRGTFKDFPMAVLVNQFSASASEIVAACLQDHERAVVIGERTFGKGSVQNIIELENGRSALKLTTASYQRPSGKNIHRFPNATEDDEWGVRPNDGYEVKVPNRTMRRLMRARADRDVARRGEPAVPTEDEEDAEAAEEPDEVLEDEVIAKAVAYLQEKLGVATAKADPPAEEDAS